MILEEWPIICGYNTKEYPRYPTLKLKLEVLHYCFELEEDVQSVLNEMEYSTVSIYAWWKRYIGEGMAGLKRPSKERARGSLKEGIPVSFMEFEELKAKM